MSRGGQHHSKTTNRRRKPTFVLPLSFLSVLVSLSVVASVKGFSITPRPNASRRCIKPSFGISATTTATTLRSTVDVSKMNDLAEAMKERAAGEQPYTEDEVEGIVTSLRSLLPEGEKDALDFEALRSLLSSVAHLSHKQWDRTAESSSKLYDVLSPKSGDDLSAYFKSVMDRVLDEGNWYGAADAAKNRAEGEKPWAILVTGVNGIRKTTSVYQPWFAELLREALVPPEGADEISATADLPTGRNSFFRQLDHMIVVLANTEFERLYRLTAESSPNNDDVIFPTPAAIDSYARLKDAIFTRYRTLAEMLGIVLLRLSVEAGLNVMVETSGRDVAMFHYVQRFFPADRYRRLVLHFSIDDLSHAARSVDGRMTDEIRDGVKAATRRELVRANRGGPYGSEVLPGIQRDSDAVWRDQVVAGNVGADWYKAEIAIQGDEVADWTARSVVRDADGEVREGSTHIFTRRES